MTSLPRVTAVGRVGRTVACAAVAILLASGASGCGAAINASSDELREEASSSTPESTASADPQRLSIPSTAPAPIVERRTVGAAAPGVIEQLSALNNTITSEYPTSIVQAAWREDDSPHAQIILQGEIPDALWTLLGNAPLQVDVALPHGPTVDESIAVIGAMADVVRASSPEATSSGRYDTLTGVYEFSYSAPRAIDPAAFAALTGGAAIELWYAGTEPVVVF
jgi:hypothetical protein